MELKVRRYSLKKDSGGYASNLVHMLPDTDGPWCYYEEVQEGAMKVAGKTNSFLVIEKQILREIALGMHSAVSELCKHPSCTHLVPCRESLTKLAELTNALEAISK